MFPYLIMKPLQIKDKKLTEYGDVTIYRGFPQNFYELKEEKFSEQEVEIAESLIKFFKKEKGFGEIEKRLNKIAKELREIFEIILSKELIINLSKQKDYENIFAKLSNALKKFGIKNYSKLAKHIIDNSIGFGVLKKMMEDKNLEEIMVNPEGNVFIFHREFGVCKTNLKLDENFLEILLKRVSNYANRPFDDMHPLLDARLPDKSRINATHKYITNGYAITIRKFLPNPYSIVSLIENNTMSPELAAFLWVCVEGLNMDPQNIICTGGAGSGKTTTLNALTSFINLKERIITIEDTLELNLVGRENWIQMEAKLPIHGKEITMDDLLKNALRMRPDRIIVGEVRGKEAETLFVAMDIGHRGCLGTLHANTAREMLIRLKNHPMNVPEQMLPLLNLILVHNRIYHPEKGLIRRISQVAEVSRMGEKVLLSNLFEWDYKKDEIKRNDVPSEILQQLSYKTGLSVKAIMNEIEVRKRILEWMLENNIKSHEDVLKTIQSYYYDPDSLLKKISKLS